MRYAHRDRANRAVPVLCALVLGGLDLALVAAGPSFPWGLRAGILAVLGFGVLISTRAIPEPERWGWITVLALYAGFVIWPPERFSPGRLILGALLLAGLFGLLVWHARRKRKALWSGD